ncbi:MAG TPA: hypothetical protein VLI06_11890 [Solimonas sp.]|nr:hypothetical protein [Solimonas sp.]
MALTGVSRRRFLQTLGMAVAGSSAPALAWAHSRPPLRLTILQPAFAPAQARAWLDGLRLALHAEPAIEAEWLTPGAGLQAQFQAIAAAAARGAEIIVTALSPRVLDTAARSLAAQSSLLFNLEAGAQRMNQASSQVYGHSLHLWQATAALGLQGVQQYGPRAALLASFRESGYDTTTAFHAGVELAGGVLMAQLVLGIPGTAWRDAQRAQELAASAADFTLVCAHGSELQRLQQLSRGTRLQGPLPERGGAAPEAAFVRSFHSRNGYRPDAYALLGLEGGLLLADAAARRAEGLDLSAALASARVSGPRGELAMDPQQRSTRAPAFVDLRGGRLPLSVIDETLVFGHQHWAGAVSGWTCVYTA